MPKNAVILGMPRSGTSLTANVFVRKGYHVGESRLPYLQHGDDHNPFGYFEADDVVDRNVELFRRVDYRFQNTWRFERLPDAAAEAIWKLEPRAEDRRFIKAYAQHSPWVWKDQRLCFTLPYWWKLMDPATTGVLLIRRDPRDIYKSFHRIGWCSLGKEEEARIRDLNAQHLGAAAAAIRALSIPHIEVDYAEFTRSPNEVARRIAAFFELDLSAEDLNVRAELDHSRLRGRASARLRVLLKQLPRGPIRRLERLLPRWAVAAVFPERKFVRHASPGARALTEKLAREDITNEAERHVASRLLADPLAVATAARLTWGRSLSAEFQDRIAARNGGGQGEQGDVLRAQITDELIRELALSLPAPPATTVKA
jgi:hypothetical protein